MAFRRVGKAVGVVVGLGFIGAQFAASSGYVQIDWEKVKDDAIKPLDAVSYLLESTLFIFDVMAFSNIVVRTR